MTYKEQLLEALLDNSLEKIANIVCEELHCYFNVTDSYFHLLYQTPKQPIQDLIWDSYLENRMLPANIINALNENHLIEKGSQALKPYIVKGKNIGDFPRVCARLYKNGKDYGHITAYILDREITDDDFGKMEIAAQVVTQCLENQSHHLANIHNIYEYFLNQLFHGLIRTQEDLDSWQVNIGQKLGGEMYLLCAKSTGASNVPLLQSVMKKVQTMYHYNICTIYKDQMYILFDQMEDMINQRFMEDVVQLLQLHNLKIGISEKYTQLIKTIQYRKQAQIACDYAEFGKYVFFSNCALEALAKELTNKNRAMIYVHPAFDILQQYDEKNKTEYYRTLVAYIQHFGRQNDMEKELGVHRNTVHNRIQTIEELVSIDLSDAYTFTHLYMSYCILIDCE